MNPKLVRKLIVRGVIFCVLMIAFSIASSVITPPVGGIVSRDVALNAVAEDSDESFALQLAQHNASNAWHTYASLAFIAVAAYMLFSSPVKEIFTQKPETVKEK